jgi:spermidine/putrescine transport system ATP-binding protein
MASLGPATLVHIAMSVKEVPPGAPRDAAPDIEFVEVSKRFEQVAAVDRVSLSIRRGAFHSFLGPSGCGKTTSLRLIAGFEQPSAGDVRIGGRSMVGIPPYRRPVNMVFQHYALFPHLDVGDNIGYGLHQRKARPSRAESQRQVAEMLELVRLPGLARRRVWELSGGQQQRVALARALINRPTVLLLDEPLAALDRKLRREMQMELQSLQREVGITFVLVTHDQEEALSMSDTISIMRDGRIEQTANPRELYEAPVNRYVADFVGESNFLAGELLDAGAAAVTLRTSSGVVVSAPRLPGGAPPTGAGGWVVALRPEAIGIRGSPGPGRPAAWDIQVPGRVINRIYLGDQTEFNVMTDLLGNILVRVPKHESEVAGLAPGDPVEIGWRRDSGLALADA